MDDYLIQSGISLASFYFVYWLLIRHKQNFSLNRIFILFSIIISCILPLLDIQLIGSGQEQIIRRLDPILISGMENQFIPATARNSISIFSIVYIIGLLAIAVRSISGLATLCMYYWRFPRKDYYGFTAIILKGNQSPFTFFNLLFINQSDYEKGKISELIVHEKAHRDQYHSIDLILLEFVTIIQWFNPFIWLIKKDLKSEHEFLADEQVINQGFDKTRYQSLLLKSHEGMALYLANNFNYSILKKRLIMMTKQKSNRLFQMNYALALPIMVLTAIILFFNFQLNNQIASSPDVLPEYKAGEKAFYGSIQKTITYPLEARKKNVQGTIYISFTVNKNGSIEDIKAEEEKYNLLSEVVVVGYSGKNAPKIVSNEFSTLQLEGERVIALLEDFDPGLKDEKPVNTRMTIPITFKIQ